jgi:hypothetical protein
MRTIPKTRVSDIQPLIAPTGGIDDTSPLADMGEQYALRMVNLFPESGALRVRKGYREHVTNLPSPARTLVAYLGVDELYDRLFACTDSGIYDVTASQDGATLEIALTNGDCQWTQFTNIAGNFLIVCNGIDPAVIYNGTTWTVMTEVATVPEADAPGKLVGLDPATIVDVHVHKNRIWFAERDSSVLYFLPVNALAGELGVLNLSFSMGGWTNCMFTWTMDAAESTDDLFIAQSSEGEIFAYTGMVPDDPADWRRVARYSIGAPLGRKSVAPYNGDHLMMTKYGLVSFSKLVGGQTSQGDQHGTASGRISRTINDIVRGRQNSEGWEVVNAPSFQYIILSLPEYSGEAPYQFVMNSLTGAWTTFDLPAETFIEYKGLLYFADSVGTVFRHGDSDMDNVALDGMSADAIVSGFQQAFYYFGTPGQSKHYKLIRPIFETAVTPQFVLDISTDFSSDGGLADLPVPALVEQEGVFWDDADWDEDIWVQRLDVHQDWIGLRGAGYCASLSVRISSTEETRYVASNWVVEGGMGL